MERLGRFGYACKAVIYAIIGGLAVAAAAGRGGRVTDTRGALRVVLSQPFGRGLLFFLGVGLCGYAVWRVADAYMDPDRRGTSVPALVIRIANVFKAAIYGMIGVQAFTLAHGLGASRRNDAAIWTARFMDWPGGGLLIGLVGAIVGVYGLAQVIKSLKGDRDETVDYSRIPAQMRPLAIGVSLFGVAARGLIVTTLGIFLVRAAYQHDPSEAHGPRESILEIAALGTGRWMLAAIGAGLLAYAIDQAIHARWRRIRPVV
jgi:uncharacterized protein DUF1206